MIFINLIISNPLLAIIISKLNLNVIRFYKENYVTDTYYFTHKGGCYPRYLNTERAFYVVLNLSDELINSLRGDKWQLQLKKKPL